MTARATEPPGSTAAVAQWLREATRRRVAVALESRRKTARPRSGVIDLRRLDAIEVDEVARLVRAQAGVTIAVLERELRTRGLSIGPLANREPRARLGTLLQEPEPADRSPRYGRLVDACVGLEAVLGDGTVVGWRDSPRKAVGPDWRALVLGAGASVAILTTATLRVHGIPEAVRPCAYRLPDRAAALRVAREAARRDVRPASWWVSGRTLSAVLEGPAALVGSEHDLLGGLVKASGGSPADPAPRPTRRARHAPWSALLGGRAAVSEMTLDGGCLHDHPEPRVRWPVRLDRALRAARIGA